MDPFRDILVFLVGAFFMLGLVAMFEFLVARYPDVSLLYAPEHFVQSLFQNQTP